MKVLLDTNVILDYILDRKDFSDSAETVFKAAFNGNIVVYITATTISDIYYIVKKQLGHEKTIFLIKELVAFSKIAAVNTKVILDALDSGYKDFEDAIQVFSASLAGIDIVVTRNKKDFQQSNLKIYSPVELCEFYDLQ